jgi:hypothetical protein
VEGSGVQSRHYSMPTGKQLFASVSQRTFGSIINNVEEYQNGGTHMRARRKNENRSDWWLTVEYFGRELRKLYPPVDVPPGLHALFTRERRRTRANAPKRSRVPSRRHHGD